jgi:hypothetical protein
MSLKGDVDFDTVGDLYQGDSFVHPIVLTVEAIVPPGKILNASPLRSLEFSACIRACGPP